MKQEESPIEQVITEILRSSKYKSIDKHFIRKIVEKEFSKNKKIVETVKATKNKLHQVGGAFYSNQPKYSFWLRELKSSKGSGSDQFRETCARIMRFHSSTKERLEILDKFYADIFSEVSTVNSVIDLACGLNPLSILWMPHFEELEYYAYDIYADLVDFLNAFIKLVAVDGQAEVRDVLFNPPKHKGDLALILKTVPCFDQINTRAVPKMLEQVNVDNLVISFPVKSLGGIEKMMVKNYTERFDKIACEKDWDIKKMLFKTELVFLVSK